MLRVITALEFFQHYFAKMGHRNTCCDPHLHPSHQATNAALPHAKRPPPGGYVQTRKPEMPGNSTIYPECPVSVNGESIATLASIRLTALKDVFSGDVMHAIASSNKTK